MNDHFLGRDRPLGESRLLYEIGPEGADLRDLRRRLGLDAGYVTRLTGATGSRRDPAERRPGEERELVLVGVAEHGVTPIRTYTEEEALELGLIGEDDDLDDDPPRADGPQRLDREPGGTGEVADPEQTVADCLDPRDPLWRAFWDPLATAVLNTPPATSPASA